MCETRVASKIYCFLQHFGASVDGKSCPTTGLFVFFRNPYRYAIFWPSKATVLEAPRRQISYTDSKKIQFLSSCLKKCKFQNPQDSGVAGCQNGTLQKRAKNQILLPNLKFCIFPIFNKKHASIRIVFSTVDPRCQTRAVPERPKIRILL